LVGVCESQSVVVGERTGFPDRLSFQQFPYFGWDIVRDFEISVSGIGGVALDGYGGVHPRGDLYTSQLIGPYFGWDIARNIDILKGTANNNARMCLLDGFGGIHSVEKGTSVRPIYDAINALLSANPLYFGWDIAKDIEVKSDGAGNLVGFYVLDGFGGVHTRGSVTTYTGLPYFGWDIARDLEVDDFFGYMYILDGFGGLHCSSGSCFITSPPDYYFYANDVARDLEISKDGKNLFVLINLGSVYRVGSLGNKISGRYFGWDIACSLSLNTEPGPTNTPKPTNTPTNTPTPEPTATL